MSSGKETRYGAHSASRSLQKTTIASARSISCSPADASRSGSQKARPMPLRVNRNATTSTHAWTLLWAGALAARGCLPGEPTRCSSTDMLYRDSTLQLQHLGHVIVTWLRLLHREPDGRAASLRQRRQEAIDLL